MSGGSLEYAYSYLNEVANTVFLKSNTSLHKAFAEHLRKVATALHDLEWVWSGDYEDGDEVGSIEAVLSKQEVLDTTVTEAKKINEELNNLIRKISLDKMYKV